MSRGLLAEIVIKKGCLVATDRQHIEGYEAPIHRALWERILTMGAPRIWSAVWLVLCLYVALLFMTLLGFRYIILPGIFWALGQGTMMYLTLMDTQWDDIALAHLTRRYKGYYDA